MPGALVRAEGGQHRRARVQPAPHPHPGERRGRASVLYPGRRRAVGGHAGGRGSRPDAGVRERERRLDEHVRRGSRSLARGSLPQVWWLVLGVDWL